MALKYSLSMPITKSGILRNVPDPFEGQHKEITEELKLDLAEGDKIFNAIPKKSRQTNYESALNGQLFDSQMS
jgi:hypothetical protein